MAETFGRTDTGVEASQSDNYITTCKFTSGSEGTLEKLSIYIKQFTTNTGEIKCAIYDSSRNLLTNGTTEGKSIEADQDGWMHFNFAIPPSVLASTVYWLAWWTTCRHYYHRVAGSSGQREYDDIIYGDWPSTFVPDDVADHEVSIYATYEEAPPVGEAAIFFGHNF